MSNLNLEQQQIIRNAEMLSSQYQKRLEEALFQFDEDPEVIEQIEANKLKCDRLLRSIGIDPG